MSALDCLTSIYSEKYAHLHKGSNKLSMSDHMWSSLRFIVCTCHGNSLF